MAKEPTDYRKLLLAHMPDTIPEIARKARVGHKTVRRWLLVFKRPDEKIKVGVVGWTTPRKGPPAPIFGPTTEPDVPRPVPVERGKVRPVSRQKRAAFGLPGSVPQTSLRIARAFTRADTELPQRPFLVLGETMTTPWFWIGTDGQPEKPGWYDVLYMGEPDDLEHPTRMYWDGQIWKFHPDHPSPCIFGNFDCEGERWRGATTPIAGMYI